MCTCSFKVEVYDSEDSISKLTDSLILQAFKVGYKMSENVYSSDVFRSKSWIRMDFQRQISHNLSH